MSNLSNKKLEWNDLLRSLLFKKALPETRYERYMNSNRKHWKTEKYKITQKKYKQSEKGKETNKRSFIKYIHSEKGKEARKRANKKYRERKKQCQQIEHTAY